jgi:hypothetical protein
VTKRVTKTFAVACHSAVSALGSFVGLVVRRKINLTIFRK